MPTPVPVFDPQGRRVFESRTGQVLLVVEGAEGLSGLPPATALQPQPPSNRADLQIQNTIAMGDGSPTVCDTGPASAGGGGIPGINPPNFDPFNTTVTNTLNDFACRFEVHGPSNACTQTDATGESKPISPLADVQFCNILAATELLHPGQNILSVKLRDTAGNLGPTAQIVIRVATPTPTP
jgi:hypothetical protein